VSADDKIHGLEFYDKSNNLILFTNFIYDGNGTMIGQTVFAPDTFFFRSTSIEKGSDGRPAKENATNFNDFSAGSLEYSYNGPTTQFSMFDEFGGLLFKGSYQDGKQLENYTVKDQQGQTVATLHYSYTGNGVPSLIDITDAAGTKAFTVKVVSGSLSAQPLSNLKRFATNYQLTRHGVQLSFSASSKIRVSGELFDLRGRLIAVIMSREFQPGVYREFFSYKNTGSTLTPQTGILRIRIGDRSFTGTVNLTQIAN
jgi:hypothetical protein